MRSAKTSSSSSSSSSFLHSYRCIRLVFILITFTSILHSFYLYLVLYYAYLIHPYSRCLLYVLVLVFFSSAVPPGYLPSTLHNYPTLLLFPFVSQFAVVAGCYPLYIFAVLCFHLNLPSESRTVICRSVI